MRKVLFSLLFLFTMSTVLVGCREEKTTGEKIEESVDEVGEDLEEGVEEIEDEIDDATDDSE